MQIRLNEQDATNRTKALSLISLTAFVGDETDVIVSLENTVTNTFDKRIEITTSIDSYFRSQQAPIECELQ